MTTNYHLKNIRTLLTEGFAEEELRNFCYDTPSFKSAYNKIARNSSKADIINQLLEYANQTLQLEILLTWAKEHNSARYEEHQPYIICGQFSSPPPLSSTPEMERQCRVAKNYAKSTKRGKRYSLDGFDLRNCNLKAIDLSGASLCNVNLAGTDLRAANLRDADLRCADLSGANLFGADLQGVNLRGARLFQANLGRTDLRAANLRESNLLEANLSKADLEGIHLRGAFLRGAKLEWFNLITFNKWINPITDLKNTISKYNKEEGIFQGGISFSWYWLLRAYWRRDHPDEVSVSKDDTNKDSLDHIDLVGT